MSFLTDFFSRGGRVARGQMNKGMDQVEDATFESTVKQTVRDMRAELAKTINASAMAMSNHNRLESEYVKYVRQSEEWVARANQALDAGQEELARKALQKKSESDEQVRSMQPGVEAARNASEQLTSFDQIGHEVAGQAEYVILIFGAHVLQRTEVVEGDGGLAVPG